MTTIVAPATPPGRGGIGIIRVSGSFVTAIIPAVLHQNLQPRYAAFSNFYAANNEVIDQGVALYFAAPNSFTGEDVLELHCHGGPVVVDMLLQRILELNTRMAKPGEFMERAFLNHKIDLAQAEAVADLIDAASAQAAQNAVRTLQGEFSQQVKQLGQELTDLRVLLEASIDFSDQTTAPSTTQLELAIQKILQQLVKLKNVAKQGVILRDGITVVIAGKPNTGKSSLFNYLNGYAAAIVTAIPGTTRDILRARVILNELPINIVDTAGLREQPDLIEQEGIYRAKSELHTADHILLMAEASKQTLPPTQLLEELCLTLPQQTKLTVIYNKIDLINAAAKFVIIENINCIYLSVKTQQGLDLLREHLVISTGLQPIESGFSARRRHLAALDQATKCCCKARQTSVIELMAEELRLAQQALGEITGEFVADDLLGKIFAEFCLGK